MLKRFFQYASLYLWTPTVILFVICAIFYTALHFYASSAMDQANLTQKMSVALLDKILALRMLLCGIFCLLIGYMGVKLTGHILPATIAHTCTVAALLLVDLSFNTTITHYDITLLILGCVAAVTALAGAATLAFFWLRKF